MIDRRLTALPMILALAALVTPVPVVAAAHEDPELNGPHDHERERIVIDVEDRRLWLIAGEDTLMTLPVAVGKGGTYTVVDHTHSFATPKGQRKVLAKEESPIWTPPDWHYYEKAEARGLDVVALDDGEHVALSDGTAIEVRGDRVGRVNRWGKWWPFTPGSEIIFDGKIFMPPLTSPQREIPNALGPAKLDLGNGYMIHGTHRYNRTSVGTAASHGCIRMDNRDLLELYDHVDVSTPVVIT